MSGICKGTSAITSVEQLNQPYPTTSSILTMVTSNVGRDSEGRLTEATMKAVYDELARNGRLMSLQTYKQKLALIGKTGTSRSVLKAELESIGKVEQQTMKDIGSEFCFYYVRYKFSLDDLFNTLVSTSTAKNELTDAQKNAINAKLATARGFNQKLNDIIQITNYVAVARSEEMVDQNEEINALNSSIQETYSKLAQANELLKREDSGSELKKRMVEFTQEKNLSANSLLSLYGFLNLVALGLLFYISRS